MAYLSTPVARCYVILFLLGVILGGIVGVLCDRIWGRYERLVRINIETFFEISQKQYELGKIYLILRIRNVGHFAIPHYRLHMFRENLVDLAVASHSSGGDLLPGQFRIHKLSKSHIDSVLAAIDEQAQKQPEKFAPIAEQIRRGEPPYKFELQLVMQLSDVVLYRNPKMGDAIISVYRRWASADLGGLHDDLQFRDSDTVNAFRDFLDSLGR